MVHYYLGAGTNDADLHLFSFNAPLHVPVCTWLELELVRAQASNNTTATPVARLSTWKEVNDDQARRTNCYRQ